MKTDGVVKKEKKPEEKTEKKAPAKKSTRKAPAKKAAAKKAEAPVEETKDEVTEYLKAHVTYISADLAPLKYIVLLEEYFPEIFELERNSVFIMRRCVR